MVVLFCVFKDGIVKVQAYLFCDVGMDLLEWSDGMGKGLACEVRMWLMDLRWFFTRQLVAGLWLEEAWCFRVGMRLCLDCLTESFWCKFAVCGSVLEGGPVMVLFLVLEGPEMRGSYCSDGPGMGLPWCMDGLEKGVVSVCMGKMWCLL